MTIELLEKTTKMTVCYSGVLRVLTEVKKYNGYKASTWRLELDDGRIINLKKTQYDISKIVKQ